ncbi:MAG: TIGR03915 family putative DNA repair protein [Treponema sp.]|nr:TIGR03915 family putative DNA repair protein [Treponema sp.]MCL2252521.1 TIGR03915 family putative DNA repair protein [Treponema sp.]
MMYRNFNNVFLFNKEKVNSSLFDDISILNEDFEESSQQKYEQDDIDFIINYFSARIDLSYLNENACKIYKLSSGAFDTVLHAWLSELPVEKEIFAFCKKVIASPVAADNRTDNDVVIVQNTAAKVYHEVHRMMGLLRFSPVTNIENKKEEIYIAKCAPDHFILPALHVYFTARFGETSWSIIDEKRKLFLIRLPGEKAKISPLSENIKTCSDGRADEWEELWRHYHKTINNEDRQNLDLQRQLMPQRYWKYLPEKN